jgi:hypothetical protein
MDPAPYPPKNTEETQAIYTFFGLIDTERVKTDVKILDRVPNIDGSIELVDDKQRPVGELKVSDQKNSGWIYAVRLPY